jgi:hypothetical protein
VSHPPVPLEDHATIRSGERVDVRVLRNDSDPDGDLDPTSLDIVGEPWIGEAQVNEQVMIRYQAPVVDRTRQVVVRYRICDRAGSCSEAKLKIKILFED